MDEPRVLLDLDGPCAVLTLNRPQSHNALDLEMVEAVHEQLGRIEKNRDLGVLIVTGAGDKAFLSGADIVQLRDRDALDALAGINARLFRRVEQLPIPTIAAIRGYALGGGCELALACDLRVCGSSSRLGQPEVGLGIIPGAGGTYRLPRIVGLARAKELIFTGRIIDAQEALEIDLVHEVVDDDRVLEAARDLAGRILKQGTYAVRMAKLALNATIPADTGVALEAAAQAFLFESADKKERMTRFLQKIREKDTEGGG